MSKLEDIFEFMETPRGKALFELNGSNGNKLNTIHAHLIIEEVLTDLLKLTFSFGSNLEDARLQFHQKMKLCRSLIGNNFPSDVYGSIKLLNDIRNKYAHSLSPEGVKLMEHKLVNLVPSDIFEPKEMPVIGGKPIKLELSHQEKYEKSLRWLINELVNITNNSTGTMSCRV